MWGTDRVAKAGLRRLVLVRRAQSTVRLTAIGSLACVVCNYIVLDVKAGQQVNIVMFNVLLTPHPRY